MNIKIAAFIFFNCIYFSAHSASPFKTNFQTSITHDDLIQHNELYLAYWLSTKYLKSIDRNSNLSARFKIGKKQYFKYSLDNRDQVELQFDYQLQRNNGYFSPLYTTRLQLLNEQGNNNYGSDRIALSIFKQRALSDKSELTLGYKYQNTSSHVDREIHSFFVNYDFILDYQKLIYIGLNIADEKIEVSTSSSAASLDSLARKDDISAHHNITISPGSGSSSNSIVDSDNNSLILGMVYKVSSQHAFDLLWMLNHYKSNTTINNQIISLDYFYQF